ncbi:MAG: hypothetical protein ROO70_19020 [Labrenzia sp.]
MLVAVSAGELRILPWIVDADELLYVSTESRKFNEALNDVWNVEPAAFGRDAETRQAMMNAFLCLVRVMAFQSLWRDDSEYFQKMLQNWLIGAQSILIPANAYS